MHPKQPFIVEIVKPSHYDDDGYVIQWRRALVPSNSLACVWALAVDAQQREALGPDVAIEVRGYDEIHTVVPIRRIIRRIRQAGGRGLVLLAGVQSNQFPRAADLAREFRAAGIAVAIGGFHVSGCIAMLPELPPELREMQQLGVTLFAGEAEERMDRVLIDAYHGQLQPIYNFLDDLPDLQGQVTPELPAEVAARSCGCTALDAGRGCPFRCSFCTIINVQGRKSRYRSPDDVEHLIRRYLAKGVKRFFITDDNMARNKNWEAIFDRLIQLRERDRLKFKILIQVDTMCHKIPGFIEKAARAGCTRVFIGMESVSPENLAAAKKFQNNIHEYRRMLLAWRAQRVTTYAGYILGFPADTPESIERDIRLIQRELPIDILEFFILTPLPGSADHRDLYLRGEPMHQDLNRYDLEHVTTAHQRMTPDQWAEIYDRAWHLYYSPQHIVTMLHRAHATGCGTSRLVTAILLYYGSYRFERVHPLQSGFLRRKVRSTRRSSFARGNPLVFLARRLWQTLATNMAIGLFMLNLTRMRHRVIRELGSRPYTDEALTLPEAGAPQMLPICQPGDSGAGNDATSCSPDVVPLELEFPRNPAERRRAA